MVYIEKGFTKQSKLVELTDSVSNDSNSFHQVPKILTAAAHSSFLNWLEIKNGLGTKRKETLNLFKSSVISYFHH